MTTRWILLLSLLSLALSGCGGSAAIEQPPDVEQSNPQAISTTGPVTDLPENPLELGTPESIDMPSNPPPVEKFVSLSKMDLAALLQIDVDKISLVKTEEIIWPDAALGCPSPGVVYAQGRVPGYRVWLEAQGKEYDYHTDLTGLVILCPEQASRNSDFLPPSSPTPHIGVPID